MRAHYAGVTPDELGIQLPAVWTRADLLRHGHHDRSISRLVKNGTLARIRHGSYTDGPAWRSLDVISRHRLRARAVLRRAGTDVALSHTSAALEHGASAWGLDLNDVHVCRLDGQAGRREAGVAQHRGRLSDAAVAVVNGLPVTDAARCVAEVLSIAGTEATLALAHELTHAGRTTAAEIGAELVNAERWPGTLGVHVVLPLIEVPCESVAETRFLHLIARSGLPMPVAQFPVSGPDGSCCARLDFAWPELGVWVEIDGRAKYDRLLGPGETASDVVWREKRREDEVRRRTGWRCLRVTWADLQDPERLLQILRIFLASRDSARA